jgi:hypothetical protein
LVGYEKKAFHKPPQALARKLYGLFSQTIYKMDDMEQRYLRGQFQALRLIEDNMQKLVESYDLDPENDFAIILGEVESELIECVENNDNIDELYPELNWDAQALQWLEERLTPDYESFLKQKKNIKETKSKIIFTEGEIEEMKAMEIWDDFFK